MRALDRDDPREIGGYRILRVLGAGGMGRVYLARSPGGRTVAVKVIRPELADDPGFRHLFRREVAAARRVGGAWTAPVIDADTESARPWLVTGYVAGPSVFEAVDRHGPLPEASVRTLGAGLAEALIGIHGTGLIHRDLKPTNVLLSLDGPRVIDFGISRALDASVHTRTGSTVGSPGFMSPEQVDGRDVGPATDIFSLGSVLVFAATAEGPFGAGSGQALMFRIVSKSPELGAVPPALRDLISACLAKYAGNRPTPQELLEQLAPNGGTAALIEPGWLPGPLTTDMSRRAIALLEIDELAPDPEPDPVGEAAAPTGTGRTGAHSGEYSGGHLGGQTTATSQPPSAYAPTEPPSQPYSMYPPAAQPLSFAAANPPKPPAPPKPPSAPAAPAANYPPPSGMPVHAPPPANAGPAPSAPPQPSNPPANPPANPHASPPATPPASPPGSPPASSPQPARPGTRRGTAWLYVSAIAAAVSIVSASALVARSGEDDPTSPAGSVNPGATSPTDPGTVSVGTTDSGPSSSRPSASRPTTAGTAAEVSGATGSPTKIPEDYVGTWSGSITTESGWTTSTFTVVLHQPDAQGLVASTSSHAGGALVDGNCTSNSRLISASGDGLLLQDVPDGKPQPTLAGGIQVCASGGQIKLRLVNVGGDTMTCEIIAETTGNPTGTLRRAG